ncbi:hypothetical protein [Rugamonas sp. DEMB1]|uniref:hypothetical protein n=1 Tax=Rugamonas sp. DEMB1 TaxID=3039386 RepID=UPI00244B93B3|nr:hypothetical protein [Rugamonas sp. DEMB1]WGG50741.1 hypothetical protein QC826_30925 [Rugamonas sp. DEMB1]
MNKERENLKRILAVLVLLASAVAFARSEHAWTFINRPFKGDFAVYGGGLGDTVAPTRTDKKMAFWIRGPVAKEMFAAMGPDLKGVCGTESGGRMRQRAEVSCSYFPASGYQCDFGFDLITGRSIGGSIC